MIVLLLGSTLLSAQNSGAQKQIKPYAYYPFNGDVMDYSGNQRDLEVPGSRPMFETYGKYKVLRCGEYLANYGLNTPFNIDSTWQSFAIMFYVKGDSIQTSYYPTIFDKQHAYHNGFSFQVDQGYWGFNPSYCAHGLRTIMPDAEICGDWHTVACVKRASDGGFLVFVDGKLRTASYREVTLKIDAQKLKIGTCYNWALERYFDGLLRNFTIYKGELSDKQIVELMKKLN